MMNHDIQSMTASDLQRRIASPYISRQDKETAIDEMARRLHLAAKHKILTVADYIERTQ
jgi:hypothetical protein